MNRSDQDLWNEILEDNAKGILLHQQMDTIMKDPKHPYHLSGHIDHHDAVRKVQLLTEYKVGNEPYALEVMPIVTSTVQAEENNDDDLFEFLDRNRG